MRKYKTPTRRHRTSMFCFSFQLTFISCKRIKKRKLIKKNLTFPTICLQAYNFFCRGTQLPVDMSRILCPMACKILGLFLHFLLFFYDEI